MIIIGLAAVAFWFVSAVGVWGVLEVSRKVLDK